MSCCFQIALGGGIASYSSSIIMAATKPWVLRAEHSMVPDLSPDHSIFHGESSSSSRRRDLVFIVNPRGANGRTGEQWKRLLPYLQSRLDKDCNICESLTSGPYHAIDITREAIREGADAVIAVGGDGTLHEVQLIIFHGLEKQVMKSSMPFSFLSNFYPVPASSFEINKSCS